jgi:hypothetical protein
MALMVKAAVIASQSAIGTHFPRNRLVITHDPASDEEAILDNFVNLDGIVKDKRPPYLTIPSSLTIL